MYLLSRTHIHLRHSLLYLGKGVPQATERSVVECSECSFKTSRRCSWSFAFHKSIRLFLKCYGVASDASFWKCHVSVRGHMFRFGHDLFLFGNDMFLFEGSPVYYWKSSASVRNCCVLFGKHFVLFGSGMFLFGNHMLSFGNDLFLFGDDLCLFGVHLVPFKNAMFLIGSHLFFCWGDICFCSTMFVFRDHLINVGSDMFLLGNKTGALLARVR